MIVQNMTVFNDGSVSDGGDGLWIDWLGSAIGRLMAVTEDVAIYCLLLHNFIASISNYPNKSKITDMEYRRPKHSSSSGH